ncbi:MAG: hypothetical protein AB7E51_06720 [Pseudodesulfovibrio sp.]|uniref:hypothetical protein n=1 Tax=Pseudodesulfovibrio sp. TaxID=2035812 RepID=UPI003D14BA7F
MPVYELAPIDLTAPDWRASTHHAPCLVRANNEQNARLAATLAFVIAVRHEPGADTAINPWNQEDMVEAHLVAEHGFDEEGPQVVLAPTGDHPTLELKDGGPVN